MRTISVVPYDPAWPGLFEKEKAALQRIFGSAVLHWHHIGSTAVPGLAAKPVIDILGEAVEPEQIDRFNLPMAAAAYTAKGEYGIAGRRFFFREINGMRSHHVHIFAAGHAEVQRHLRFRDYLRSHPSEATGYAQLKQALAEKFPTDAEAYSNGKGPLIRLLEQKALSQDIL